MKAKVSPNDLIPGKLYLVERGGLINLYFYELSWPGGVIARVGTAIIMPVEKASERHLKCLYQDRICSLYIGEPFSLVEFTDLEDSDG